MKKILLPFLLVFGAVLSITFNLNAQISQPGTPPSFVLEGLKSEVPIENMRDVDVEKLKQEDLVLDEKKDIPWRFGENIDVNINPGNAGRWDYLDNGGRIWRTAVFSKGAYSINLTFDDYKLPQGAQLYVYNHERTMVIGAFTDFNNQDDNYFATTLVHGEHIIIEYYEPANVEFPGRLNLGMVTHAYRNPYDFVKAFGQSGSCNLNVVCQEAEGWEQQIRSVAMMVSGGNGFCTGALINNTEFDGKPLFLTANHCSFNPGTIVLWFNWQSEACANPSLSPSYNSMSGAVQRSRNATSDFFLIEMNQDVPEEYNPFYAGWNRTTASTLSETIVSIHHPRGDIKKFSYSNTGVQATGYSGNPGSGTSHWRIIWSGGTTTEPASSGAPLFDSEGRIIGQLHGGGAACGNSLPDWYGRLGISWDGGGAATNRLKDWLDPGNTGVMTLDGYDPNDPGLDNPVSFNANVLSAQEVSLIWESNIATNRVMIAVNSEELFGKPEGGYTIGEEIEGGGRVLYMGDGTEFLHQNLQPNQNIYYKIWSLTEDLIYSTGVNTEAITPCAAVLDYPFLEGFNNEILSGCWSQEYLENEINWLIGVGNNDGYPYTTFEGENNIFFRTAEVADNGSITRLVSPFLDLDNWTSAILTFQYANPANIANQDTLNVYYRTEPAQEWQLLETFGANQFSWAEVIIGLPELSSQTQIAFEGKGYRGRGISIDAIEITPSLGNTVTLPSNLSAIAVDNSAELTWEIIAPDEEKGEPKLEGFNIYRNDHLIYEGTDTLQTSYSDGPLPAGTYNYKVKTRVNSGFIAGSTNEETVEIVATGNEYTLTISTEGGGQTWLPQGIYKFSPGTEITLTAIPDENWNFSHWLENGVETETEPSIALALDANLEIEAVFVLNEYTVTLAAEPEIAASALTGAGQYEHGTLAAFSAGANVGYVFSHWEDENGIVSTSSAMDLVVRSNKTLTANFMARNYTVSLSSNINDAGEVTGAGTYGINEEVAISAIVNPGFQFQNWSSFINEMVQVISTENPFSFIIEKDTVIVANFDQITHTLEIMVTGEGNVSPSAGIHTFNQGESVVLQASSADDHSFLNWDINGEIIPQPNIQILIDEDKVATVTFQSFVSVPFSQQPGSLKIFPVPARDYLRFTLPSFGENWTYQIFTASGQMLINSALFKAGDDIRVDTSKLPAGVYILRIENHLELLKARFIISR